MVIRAQRVSYTLNSTMANSRIRDLYSILHYHCFVTSCKRQFSSRSGLVKHLRAQHADFCYRKLIPALAIDEVSPLPEASSPQPEATHSDGHTSDAAALNELRIDTAIPLAVGSYVPEETINDGAHISKNPFSGMFSH